MRVVLDASAAVGAVAGDKKQFVTKMLVGTSRVIAPDLFIPEVTNGLWKYIYARALTLDEAFERFDSALTLVNRFYPVADLAPAALREAAAHRHPAYDLYYVVLARREGAAILTVDGRMKDLCRAIGVPLADA